MRGHFHQNTVMGMGLGMIGRHTNSRCYIVSKHWRLLHQFSKKNLLSRASQGPLLLEVFTLTSAMCFTWNHCPPGRAGLMKEAKKTPQIPNKGHAISMRVPCARTKGSLGKSSPSPLVFTTTGLYFFLDIVGNSSCGKRESGSDSAFLRP